MYKVLFSFFVFSTSLTFGQTWIAMGSGVNQEVFVVDSFNNDIYAGGYFTTAG